MRLKAKASNTKSSTLASCISTDDKAVKGYWAKLLAVCVIQLIGTVAVLAGSDAKATNIVMRRTDTLRAVVENVVDNRDSRSVWDIFEVYVRFEGGPITPETVILRVHITNALESTGRDLLTTHRIFKPDEWPNSWPQPTTRIRLKAPAREANALRIIKGDVEFYNPDATNAQVVTLDDAFSNANVPITHSLLSTLGVTLTPIDKKRFTADNSRKLQEQNEKPKLFQDLVSQSFSNAFVVPRFQTNMVAFEISDPKQIVARIYLRERDGRSIRELRRIRWENFYFFILSGAPPKGLKADVHLALPDVVTKSPFRLEHIPLP